MIRFTCTACKQPFNVPASYAGKRTRCPSCKQPIQIPGPAAAQIQPPAAQTQPAADANPFAMTPADEGPAADDSRAPLSSLAKEPWFYKYLERMAYAIMIVALCIVCFAVVAGALTVVVGFTNNERGSGPITIFASALWVFWALLWSAGVAFWCAMILLLVDIGRKLRIIAKNTSQ